VRFDQAREAGLTEELVEDITDDHQQSDLSERYKTALAWADNLLAGGSEPDDQLKARLRQQFSDAEIMELTYAMGSFIGYSKQLIMLGLEPEAMPVIGVPIPS